MNRGAVRAGEVAYRVLTPRWSHRPLSGAGAATNGGRFNRPGLEAVYLSADPQTALDEYRQDMALVTPVTLAAFVIGPFDCIDLTEGADADRPAPWSEWRCPWKLIARIQQQTPPSWLCGDQALALGVPAIRFASTRRSGGINLVVFPGLAPAGTLAVYDPDNALPRDPSSWVPS